MQIFLDVLVIAVAVEHIFIMLLEMFFIKSSVARKTFNIDSKLLDRKESCKARWFSHISNDFINNNLSYIIIIYR